MNTQSSWLYSILFLLLTTSLTAQNFNVQLRSKLTFPGQTLANVFGHEQNGREYALVGGSKGLIIVDITNPDNPAQIIQIPGPDNLWKEIKTYRNVCYITSEGGGGVQVIDMSNLPSSNVPVSNYTGDGPIFNALNTIHALHIDTTLGFLYAYGTNLFSGGAVVLDIHTDPLNPRYVGKFDQLGYIHDGYADNDTLYACHIFSGLLSIVDMREKANPVLLGTIQTPGKFTHNSWLTIGQQVILTTDEATPSFVTAYDISDPSDIRELDRISTNDGNNSIGHNTHVLNNWAITSWYTDGVAITDAHKPDNLVMTGLYDTWNGTGPSFDGCWGAYPLFPSGNMVATNISPGELFVLTPTYQRAAYLEGFILDGCTGLPLSDALVDVASADPWVDTRTNANGVFKTGQTATGTFVVNISKPGYSLQTIEVDLQAGVVANVSLTLEPESAFSVTGQVVDDQTGLPMPNASIVLAGNTNAYTLQTNANGQFDVNCILGDDYVALASSWGYLPDSVDISGSSPVEIRLKRGYYDDFGTDLGWNTEATATAGFWVREKPIGTLFQNNLCNPDDDITTDRNDRCFVTGNGGGSAGSDDVDNGTVTLITPQIDLSAYRNGILTFHYWFYNGGGFGTPNDTFWVEASNGQQTVRIFEQTASASTWRMSGPISLQDFLPVSDNMQIRFHTVDLQQSGHLVEAGVDGFQLIPDGLIVSTEQPADPASIQLWPNPAYDQFFVQGIPSGSLVRLFNAAGQLVLEQRVQNGLVRVPNPIPGRYTLQCWPSNGGQPVSKTIQLGFIP